MLSCCKPKVTSDDRPCIVNYYVQGSYWHDLNGNDNTNNKSALMKQSKTNRCVGSATKTMTMMIKTDDKRHQISLQKGAGGWKFH